MILDLVTAAAWFCVGLAGYWWIIRPVFAPRRRRSAVQRREDWLRAVNLAAEKWATRVNAVTPEDWHEAMQRAQDRADQQRKETT